MSEMIDIVAKAIRAGGFGDEEFWREKAKLAIEALREPNDAMSRAGVRAIQAWESDDPDGVIMDYRDRVCWQAMIDAALDP